MVAHSTTPHHPKLLRRDVRAPIYLLKTKRLLKTGEEKAFVSGDLEPDGPASGGLPHCGWTGQQLLFIGSAEQKSETRTFILTACSRDSIKEKIENLLYIYFSIYFFFLFFLDIVFSCLFCFESPSMKRRRSSISRLSLILKKNKYFDYDIFWITSLMTLSWTSLSAFCFVAPAPEADGYPFMCSMLLTSQK